MQNLMADHKADALIAGKDGFSFYRRETSGSPFFFHPDTAMFRLKRVLRGEEDPFLAACALSAGDRFLDCTLGLATDCILASSAAGHSGKIVGIEADPVVAFITAKGLQQYDPAFPELKAAMRRIQVKQGTAVEILRSMETDSFDVVYLDPMFSTSIEESASFAPLRDTGLHGGLTDEWIAEARRVAAKRVVLKAHFGDRAFETFGFTRIRRPNTKFHFGCMET